MSSVAPGAHAPGYEYAAASRLVHIVMPVFLGLTPQAMDMSPLRGFARPAMKITVTLELRTYGRSPHFLGGDSRRAPKARQTFSLGREPQEWDRAPSVKPRSGDRYLAWGVSPRNGTGRHPLSREAATDI